MSCQQSQALPGHQGEVAQSVTFYVDLHWPRDPGVSVTNLDIWTNQNTVLQSSDSSQPIITQYPIKDHVNRIHQSEARIEVT